MEQKIIDTANKYKELALMLENFAAEQPIDEDTPEEVQTALIKLYYAKAFDVEMEKCEDLLEEETDEETVNAVEEAANAIEAASVSAFSVIDEFSFKDNELAKKIEDITISTETDNLLVKLIKLYKCEAIIRNAYMAYKYSIRDPYAGTRLSLLSVQPEQEVVNMTAEEKIKQKLGIDMYELYELRLQLIIEIGNIIERKANAL